MSTTVRRAKIVCTLGPASSSRERIAALIDAGMDVARLNCSHGDHETLRRLIDEVRGCAERADRTVAILLDLQGPKIRIDRLPGGSVDLAVDDRFTLTTVPGVGEPQRVSVSYADFAQDVRQGERLLLDDGQLQFDVEAIDGTEVHCRVVIGGKLKDRKGINVPGAVLSVPALSDKDRRDVAFGVAHGVDWIAMSFVQRPSDLDGLRAEIRAHGGEIPVMAKIEKPQAVAALDAILARTDAVMVARGDLGVEVPAEEVPTLQKRIISACNQRGIPVVTATQMLESMIQNPRPTRAEASDVANAVLDGTDAVMLSGETASGAWPVEAVATMRRIIDITEREAPQRLDLQRRAPGEVYDSATAIGYSACHAADLTGAAAIVCLTQSGSTARLIARFRPRAPILALTANAHACRQLALLWGVRPLQCPEFDDNLDTTVSALLETLGGRVGLPPGARVVLTTGLPFNARRSTNTLRIEELH